MKTKTLKKSRKKPTQQQGDNILAGSVKVNKQSLLEIQKNIQNKSPHPKKTKIIAVTKTFSIKSINSAIQNKIYKIGENKIQEAEKKFATFKDRKKIQLHLIGDLQTNKIKKAVTLFDTIQTTCRIKTIDKIDKEAGKINKKQKLSSKPATFQFSMACPFFPFFFLRVGVVEPN